ncbi:para-nitrobenzyl esterase [Paenibacillus sp. RU4T]|nr:para-nitrobenzyl esterase [Paenibacillus sp. RU4X]SIR49487.1 para-nitrobenzyl esterase [Paenibacillus sp. RU4T]
MLRLDDLIIRTNSGLVQGARDKGVRFWKGIPFAEPPVGARRFRKPLPAQPWEGTRSAVDPGPLAPQPVDPSGGSFRLVRTAIPQAEDCLNVNVWAPQEPSSKPLPVMVWIHGGSFVTGGGGLPIYDGAELARRGGLVVVTISYRLGALGFLHLSPYADGSDGDDGYVSNAGLLDQIAALEWVRSNIAAFGGDPAQVTVFGESAGGMSIAALLAMPAAKGLFRRAILQSGASQALPEQQGSVLAGAYLQLLGIEPGELDRLADIPTAELTRAADKLKRAAGESAVMLFQPVVDGKSLPEFPQSLIEAGSAEGVDILIGVNRDEGALFIPPGMPLLSDEKNAQAYVAVTGAPEAAEWTRGYPRTTEGQQQLMTDLFFWRSSLLLADAQLPYAPVWMYRYDFTVEGHDVFAKAFHAAEIPFVFNHLDLLKNAGLEVSGSMRAMAERVQDAWIAFACTGNPSTAELEWPAYEASRRATMIFDTDSRVELDPDAEKRRLLTGGN